MNKIVLYGAGKRCVDLCKILKYSNIQVEVIVDSNELKWGQVIEGIKVESPRVLQDLIEVNICITVLNEAVVNQIRQSLKMIGEYREISYIGLLLQGFLGIEFEKSVYEVVRQSDKNNVVLFDSYNGLCLGGVEEWTKDICKELISKAKHEVFIISKKGDFEIPFELQDKILFFEDVFHERYAIKLIAEIISAIVQKLPCKVVISSIDEVLVATSLIKNRYPDLIDIIAVIHNSTEFMYASYMEFQNYIDMYIGVSQDIKAEMMKRGIEESRIKTMTCPFPCEKDLRRSYTLDKKEPIHIGYAGRMDGFKHSQKRMDLLLKLIEVLEERKVNFVMELAGDGPVRITMEEKIEANGLAEKVKFLGKIERTEIPSFWKRQDICVNIADYEGRSISIIEAMGNGAVPVVTKVSGTQEDIADGINGYLIPLQDYKEMADKIQYLAEHRERLVQMGQLAHDMIYPKSMMSEHLKFWEEDVILKV